MIIFNECRIDPERKRLIVEAALDNLSYYDNINIAAVIIDTQETFVESGPSNRAIYHMSYDMLHKKIKVCLSEEDLGVSLENNIFFIYIVTNGVPAPDTPCGMDNIYTRGVAVNLRPIYNMAMKYIKELNSTCSIPKGFIDMILRIKAFELSLKTGNFPAAFKQWDRLFKNKIGVPPNKRCGCDGFN